MPWGLKEPVVDKEKGRFLCCSPTRTLDTRKYRSEYKSEMPTQQLYQSPAEAPGNEAGVTAGSLEAEVREGGGRRKGWHFDPLP